MHQRLGRVDTAAKHGTLPAAIPLATPSITPNCSALGGRCIEPGQHFDHRGPRHLIAAPKNIGDQAAIEAELMALCDGTDREPEPIASFAWGGYATELTPAELLELAQQVDDFADKLRILADQLTVAQQQYNQA